MKNNPWRLIKINILVFIALLIILEIILRLLGFQAQPAAFSFVNKNQTDSLIVYDKFYTDSNGIFKANPDWNWDESFQINEAGFRGKSPFDTSETFGKKKIMLLGDSFTWGMSAEPISESFADLLARDTNFAIYNFGIPGTAPNQYSKLAEFFIPLINPDMVLVFFYAGNDIMWEDFELIPFEKRFHITNAGWIQAHVNGRYISDAQEAYDLNVVEYLRKWGKVKFSECASIKCKIKVLCFKSVLGCRIYDAYRKFTGNDWGKMPVTNDISIQYIKNIKSETEKAGGQFFFFIIPFQSQKPNPNLFNNLSPLIIQNLTKEDYSVLPDDHFNNSGHQKYFEFIRFVIKN